MSGTALKKINYGVYIVSSSKGGKPNGQVANTVFQVTAEPVKIAVCINAANYTHACISESGVFSVSVLSKETPLKFIGTFGFKSGRDTDKFAGVNSKTGITGSPVVLDNTAAYLEAKVVSSHSVGTHTLFIGEIKASEVISNLEPMTYDYYQQVKGGKTQQNAPTYMKD